MRRMVTNKQIESLDQLNNGITVNDSEVRINRDRVHVFDNEADDKYIDFDGENYVGATDEGVYLQSEGSVSIIAGGDPVATFDSDGLLVGPEAGYGITIYGDEALKAIDFHTSEDINKFQIGYDGTDYGIWLGDNAVEYGITIDAQGHIILNGLPTSDPEVEGALWNDNGILKISAGN